MNIKERIKDHPRKWDYAIMLSLFSLLIASASYIIGAEITAHNSSNHAHPDIVAQIQENKEQLTSIEAGQIWQQVIKLDELICTEPKNRYYREELSSKISEWETITKKIFPRELVRCL